VVNEIDCREPIFSAPAVGNERVYFATLGARIYAVEPDGKQVWDWDFVEEVVGFTGNRWLGADWVKFRGDRVNWKDHFVCSRDISLVGDTVVMPAGGRTVFVKDAGDEPKLRTIGEIPSYAGKEYPATFGQSADEEGNVYIQWHRRDNAGRVEILRLGENDEITTDFVPGTETAINIPRSAGLCQCSRPRRRGLAHASGTRLRSLSSRAGCGRSRGLVRSSIHRPAPRNKQAGHLWWSRWNASYRSHRWRRSAFAFDCWECSSLCTSRDSQTDESMPRAKTGISMSLVRMEKRPLPEKGLEVTEVRSPLTGARAGEEYNWYSNYGDFQGLQCQRSGPEATPENALGASAGRYL
jgi:hypothetical protein